MNIELRPITVADAQAHAAGEDDESVRWLSGGYAPLDRVRDYLAGLEENARLRRGKRGFGIWVEGRLGGYIDLDPDVRDGLEPGDVNIAYSVHPWARGRGVAVQAVLLLCEWMAAHSIGTHAAIRVEPDNRASVKVAQRAGFTYAGEFLSATDVDEDETPVTLLLFRRPLASSCCQTVDRPETTKDAPRVLRVFHDYGAPWPLWERCDKYSMDPEDYDLSEDLTALLRRCGELFDQFHPDDGWPSHHVKRQYAENMDEAVRRLRQELSGRVIVQDERAI